MNPPNFSVTKFGKLLDPNLYTWDEKTRTFSTKENHLVLDFFVMCGVTFKTRDFCIFKTGSRCTFNTGDSCTFKTSGYCTFTTGYNCVFDTGFDCTFKTNWGCTFKTGSDCRFNTSDDCAFTTGHNCIFEVGEKCSLIYTWNDCFKVYKLEPEKLVLLTQDGKLESLLGQIQTTPYNIHWWKESQEIIIKVGCREYSLNHWKENYQKIAEEYQFRQDLIPEFLKHLEMIESSLFD